MHLVPFTRVVLIVATIPFPAFLMRNNHLKPIYPILFLLWVVGCSAQAGAWAQERGRGLAILQYFYYTTDTGFTDGWHPERFGNDGRFTKNELNLYLEYGLFDRWTIIGNFFLDSLVNESDTVRETNFGVADPELGVRYQFFDRIPQALQLTVKIPGPYSIDDVPALGNGQTDIELAYYVGHSFEFFGNYGFVDAGAGFRLRTAEPADEFRWYFTTGIPILENLDFLVEASGIHGLGNERPQIIGENILLTTDFSLIKVGASLLYRPIDGWAVQAGPYFHVAGRATGAGGGFKVAIWREF